MDLARFAIERRVISALSTFLILLLGYVGYVSLPRFEDPEFIIRQAQIVTPYPGATADEVADEVTDLIEGALQELTGVEEITSVSSPGVSRVTIEFTIPSARTRSDLSQKFTQMRSKISDIQGRLPPNVQPSQIYDDFGDVYAQYYAIIGEGFTLPELYEYAKDLQRELVLVDGVSKTIMNGVQDEVIYVEYSTARFIQLGLTHDQVAAVLEGQNLVQPGGSQLSGETRLEVRPASAVNSVEAISNLRLTDPNSGASYRLGDVATVYSGVEDPASTLLYRNGHPAIGLAISNEIGGNVVNMGDAVTARMEELIDQRPIGIDILPISDQGESVRASVNDFVGNVVLALVIVVGILLVFMGLRSGILMGGILLVTVAGTLFGMLIGGLDMQRISLGALIIALGMLVDNAIVVVEGTLVRVQKGEQPGAAAISVVNQTKWPLLGGTVVGILAFSPIGFSPDNTGEYAGSLFWTILIALLFSWLVAVWLTPYYCTLLMKAGTASGEEKPEGIIYRGYRSFLSFAIRVRYLTVLVVIGLFFSAVALNSLVPPGFFPTSTREQFVVDYFLPDGTDISKTAEDILVMDEHIRGLDGVTGTNTMVGDGHARFMLTYDSEDPNPAYGQILVDVENFQLIEPLIVEIQGWINSEFPGANSKVWKFELGPGGGSKIEARFYGPDPVVLRGLAQEAKAIMYDAGAVAIKDDWREQVKVIRPVLDTENARQLGLTQADVAQALHGQLTGSTIGVYREEDELRDIILRPVEEDRSTAQSLRDVQVYSSVIGGYIPIAQVVSRFELVMESGNLRRIDRQLNITAQSDPAPGVLSGDLYDTVRGPIEAIPLPAGYSLTWEGEAGSSAEANEGLAMTMPIGFGAMAVVVILLFNAVRQPVIIYLTVPLALIGVIWGLAGTQTPMEFMAILGVLSLTGMLIKNAIVLIDETDSQITDGKPRLQAVKDAAVSRVRPVVLGVLTTVLGVVPLLWDPFFQSLAVVIICGLSFATILTLIIVPTLYTIFFGITADEEPNASAG